MRNSIRIKMILAFASLIILMIVLSWLLNANFLEKYYIEQTTKKLSQIAEEVNKQNSGRAENLELQLETYEINSAITSIIFTPNLDMEYPSLTRGSRPGAKAKLIRIHLDEINTKGSVAIISPDPRLATNFLHLLYKLDNGNYLALSTPLAAIEENAAIANRFFLFSGLLIMLLAVLPIYLLARKYTKPILELNDIAQSMSRLDFSRKYQGNTVDEIGELGASINSLSNQLGVAITELQAANYKLKADIERERKIDEMRKEFISNVSHELKTPISLIQGYAEGLQVNVVQDEEEKLYYCEVIIDEAHKMNKLVGDLLELSQIESGYFKLEKETFNLAELINELVNKYSPIFKEKDISPIINMEPTIMVWADIRRTEQMLVNYFNNALNHMDESKIFELNIKPLGDIVRISLFNSGANIPEEFLHKIFTSFFKVDRARTRLYGGSGLGLSIVRAIQELHGNNYGVNNLENGVEFWLELSQV